MMNIFVFFNLMLVGFLFFFFFSLILFYMDLSIMMSWLLMEINSMNMEIMFLLDWMASLFISVIFLISSMIMVYSYMYMYGNKFIERFIYLVILFIFSMILMILSPNILSILFGWDGLGLVSYCLIIFYQNYLSYNSGMVTVLCNRVGDVGLLMSFGVMMMGGGWNLWMMNDNKMLIMMLILAAITKSAQIPFSTWLPMAMAAPTPVSALVHSSTLVTAGIYLMIRFNKILMINNVSSNLLFFLSVITMFMAGLMANVENDLKKIIALSTLSQLGLMMMIMSLGFKMLAFYHLLTHAIFKSMLFMCAGIIIHSMMNNQDIRLFGNLNEIMPFTMMSFYIALLALCGFPFMAGFYSKDYIMELIYISQINILMLCMIIFSLMFTVSYSIRLFYYMFFSNIKFYSYYNYKEEGLMMNSMMVLVVMSIMVGSILNWLFFIDLNVIYISVKIKLMTLMMCGLGVVLSGVISMIKCLVNYAFMSYYFGSMWYLNSMYLWIYKPMNLSGVKVYEFDKMWVEFSSKNILDFLFKSMKYYKVYKIYHFMLLYIFLFLIIFIIY